MIDTTEDRFLGGALTLLQPKKGYRAGADPVLLASALDATAGQSVLELGCGVGTAMFCLMRRVPNLEVTGVERNHSLADLAERNADLNGLNAEILTADLSDLPPEVSSRSFDHVLANPPFFERDRGTAAIEATREGGRGEETPLAAWIDVAIRRLSPGGVLTIIQRTERLHGILQAMDERIGSICVTPLSARVGRSANNVIVSAKKGGRAGLLLETPFVLHDGIRHVGDRDTYSAPARKILREGASLSDAKLMLT